MRETRNNEKQRGVAESRKKTERKTNGRSKRGGKENWACGWGWGFEGKGCSDSSREISSNKNS
jgi:hypothetical protein